MLVEILSSLIIICEALGFRIHLRPQTIDEAVTIIHLTSFCIRENLI